MPLRMHARWRTRVADEPQRNGVARSQDAAAAAARDFQTRRSLRHDPPSVIRCYVHAAAADAAACRERHSALLCRAGVAAQQRERKPSAARRQAPRRYACRRRLHYQTPAMLLRVAAIAGWLIFDTPRYCRLPLLVFC